MASHGLHILLCKAGGKLCAVRLNNVVETMRPMPLAPIEGTLPCLMGLSVIRGKPCPVVHLARLLGEEGEPQRLVLLRLAGERRVALAVSSVEGVRRASHEALAEMPSLVSPANADLIEAVATRDADLMLLLRAGAILSEDDWKRLESA